MRKRQAIREEWFAENGPCQQCGTTGRLEAHHEDPSKKIGHTVWSWAAERRNAELEKCIVLCRTCHLKIHTVYAECGTVAAYRRGCRCSLCKEASAAAKRSWRQRTGKH